MLKREPVSIGHEHGVSYLIEFGMRGRFTPYIFEPWPRSSELPVPGYSQRNEIAIQQLYHLQMTYSIYTVYTVYILVAWVNAVRCRLRHRPFVQGEDPHSLWGKRNTSAGGCDQCCAGPNALEPSVGVLFLGTEEERLSTSWTHAKSMDSSMKSREENKHQPPS